MAKAIKAWPYGSTQPFHLDPTNVVNYWPSNIDGYSHLQMTASTNLLLLRGTVIEFDRTIGRANSCDRRPF